MSKKLSLPGKAKGRVAVLTGIHPTPCTTPFGDYYMSLQVPQAAALIAENIQSSPLLGDSSLRLVLHRHLQGLH